jgi:hypothetical protein
LHTLARIGPGHFFGEDGLAYNRPRSAHVVALEHVTCLVFSPDRPTNFAGRGALAGPTESLTRSTEAGSLFPDETISLDVAEYVPQKVQAMAAHRTQFPLAPEILPLSILREIFGHEYFVRVNPKPAMAMPAMVMADWLENWS